MKLITIEGEARSGKGTATRAVVEAFSDKNVRVIDQGQKFRALAVCATRERISVDDATQLASFLTAADTQAKMLRLLDELRQSSPAQRDAVLYTHEVGATSSKVGALAVSQRIAIELLTAEVARAASEGVELLVIDGRAMSQKALVFEQDLGVQLALGFHFRCPASVAAQRATGIFTSADQLTDSERSTLQLAEEQIAARNHSDRTRDVYPLIDPDEAVRLDLALCRDGVPADLKEATLAARQVIIDTANSDIQQMTAPVVELAREAVRRLDT